MRVPVGPLAPQARTLSAHPYQTGPRWKVVAPFRAATFHERGCGMGRTDRGFGYSWFGSFVETNCRRNPIHPNPQALESDLPPSKATIRTMHQGAVWGWYRPEGGHGYMPWAMVGDKSSREGRERRRESVGSRFSAKQHRTLANFLFGVSAASVGA